MSSTQEEKNSTTVRNDQMTLYISVWYHYVILLNVLQPMRKLRNPPERPFFIKLRLGLHQQTAKGTPYSF